MEWKVASNPKCIKVSTDTGTLKVDGKDVAKAMVEGDEFKIEWLAPEWASWEELQQSKELQEITKTSKDRLASSRANTAKGAGKGPQDGAEGARTQFHPTYRNVMWDSFVDGAVLKILQLGILWFVPLRMLKALPT